MRSNALVCRLDLFSTLLEIDGKDDQLAPVPCDIDHSRICWGWSACHLDDGARWKRHGASITIGVFNRQGCSIEPEFSSGEHKRNRSALPMERYPIPPSWGSMPAKRRTIDSPVYMLHQDRLDFNGGSHGAVIRAILTSTPRGRILPPMGDLDKDLPQDIINPKLWVRWAHDPNGTPIKVALIDQSGMLQLEGYTGYFAWRLFVEVEGPKAT